MIQGVKKFSELSLLTPNGTERLPVIQNVGGVFVNGYIDLSSVSGNLYNSDGTLTGVRQVDQGGHKLKFTNGQVLFGNTDPLIPIWRTIISGNGAGFGGLLVIVADTAITANGNLVGIYAASQTGIGFRSSAKGNVIQDFALTDQTSDPSSLLDVFTESHGTRPFPRLTETQMNAITSPADYLEVVNTTRGIKMIYNPFFGWSPVGTVPPYWGWEYHDECTGNNGGMFTITTASSSFNVFDNRKACLTLAGVGIKHLTSDFIWFSENKRTYINSYALASNDNRGCFHGYFKDPDAVLSTSLCEGVYFLVDPLNEYGYGSNISTVVKSSTGEVVTQTTVIASGVGGFRELEIRCDDSTSTAIFLIDGVVVASDSTNYPLNENQYYAGESFYGDGGGGDGLILSHTTLKEKFGTPR